MNTFVFRNLRGAALALGLTLAASSGVAAGEITGDTTFTWAAQGALYTVSGNQPYFLGAFSGLYHFDDESVPLHHAALQCPGYNAIGADAAGHCTIVDKDGDQLYLTWSCAGIAPPAGALAACQGEVAYSGGTGKWSAASGAGHMHGVIQAAFADGTSVGYTEVTGISLTY
ncbi:MAG: hypothetical protein KDJ19_07020 [Hyphomicrobiaceae bacterium]|nr:hypothetical protein [Hyphomicrobiaceae bacterium]MCC0023829.1 hypothetical protein [Hyphomicrobiaceae bacterium]